MDHLTIKSSNNIQVFPNMTNREAIATSAFSASTTIETRSLNNKNNTVAYSTHALKIIGEKIKHDQRVRHIQYGTKKRIKELKLNHKLIRNRNKTTSKGQFHRDGANNTNLITIKKKGFKGYTNIIFTTCNIQSIRFKELQVNELIED